MVSRTISYSATTTLEISRFFVVEFLVRKLSDLIGGGSIVSRIKGRVNSVKGFSLSTDDLSNGVGSKINNNVTRAIRRNDKERSEK